MTSWPLRVRVALAFLLATAVALAGLGAFVLLRVEATLEERLDDALEAELDRVAGVQTAERAAAAETPPGELFVQVYDADGRLAASSPGVVGELVPGERPDGYHDATVSLLDEPDDEPDDDDNDEDRDEDRDEDDTERVPARLLVTTVDGGQVVVGTPRDDTDEAVAEVRTQLLVGGPAALLLAGLLGYLVAGAGLRPIERMRARAATISDRSAGERLPLPVARDELRRLAETLNAMLDRLDEGLDRQRRFVAEASHELRTPLTLMRTELDLALDRPRTSEELTEALRSTDEEVRRLIDLADRLLVLAAADAGRLGLELGQVDLRELAHDVVRRFAPRAAELGRSLTVESAQPTGPVVNGDRGRLDQVLSNLVDNALRHGAGAVTVSIGASRSSVTLSVLDEGPGISERRLFERFNGSHGGQGLGLAIVREIVLAHGGTVDAEPADDDPSGSPRPACVVVRLPRGDDVLRSSS